MSFAHAVRGSKRGSCEEIPGSPVCKSAWERNVFRVLHRLGYEIEYEPEHFRFPEPYRRAIDYTPDFRIRKDGIMRLVEVKGWLDGPSKTRLLGFRKHFPDLARKLLIVTRDRKNVEWVTAHLPEAELWDYSVIRRQLGFLVAWEG